MAILILASRVLRCLFAVVVLESRLFIIIKLQSVHPKIKIIDLSFQGVTYTTSAHFLAFYASPPSLGLSRSWPKKKQPSSGQRIWPAALANTLKKIISGRLEEKKMPTEFVGWPIVFVG